MTLRVAILLACLIAHATGRHVKILLPGAAEPEKPPVKQGGCKVDPSNYAKKTCVDTPNASSKRKQPSCFFCKDDVSNKAGWGSDVDSKAEKLAKKHFGSCNINIIDATKLTREVFKRDYEGKKPFILTGFADSTRGSMSKPELIKKHGKKIISRRTMNNLAAAVYGDLYSTREELQELMDTEIFTPWTDDRDHKKPYPSLGKSPEFSKWFEGTTLTPLISVGTSKQGLPFRHSHGNTFVVLHHGKTQWFLNNPGRAPTPLMQWARPWKWLSKLQKKDKPEFMCTQLPGEVIYIPEFWWHASLNIGMTFGYGAQDNNVADDAEALRDKLKGRELDQPIHELNYLVATGKRAEAMKLAEKAMKANKGEVPISILYAQLKSAAGDREPAKVIFQGLLSGFEDARQKKVITKQEGAFIFMKLAGSIANAGFNPDHAIHLSNEQSLDWYSEKVMRDLIYALMQTKQPELASKTVKMLAEDERWKDDDHGKMWAGYLQRMDDKKASRGMLSKLAKEIKQPAGGSFVVSPEPETLEF